MSEKIKVGFKFAFQPGSVPFFEFHFVDIVLDGGETADSYGFVPAIFMFVVCEIVESFRVVENEICVLVSLFVADSHCVFLPHVKTFQTLCLESWMC